eukprot:jgi/Ulvmu1/4545/UM002_0271.1
MTGSIPELEAKAQSFEARISALEKAVAGGKGASASADPVEHFKANLLALKEQLLKAQEEVQQITQERDDAVKRADKLQYQCDHLKKSLHDQDAKTGHPAEKS